MTTAVCFKCGAMKFGAFNACPKCSVTPTSEEDYAISLAMTDHYFPRKELEKMSGQLANGEKLHIDPEVKSRFIQLLRAEGVATNPDTAAAFVPTDTLNLVENESAPTPRKWWKFWKH